MDTEEVVEKKLVKNIWSKPNIDANNKQLRFISILLKEVSLVEKFFHDKVLTKDNFDTHFHEILKAIEIQYKNGNKTTLSRDAYSLIVSNNINNNKKIMIREATIYNRIYGCPADVSTYDSLLDTIVKSSLNFVLSNTISKIGTYLSSKGDKDVTKNIENISNDYLDNIITIEQAIEKAKDILYYFENQEKEEEEEEEYNTEQQNTFEYRLEDNPIDMQYFPEIFRDLTGSFRYSLYSINDTAIFASCLSALITIIGKRVFTVNEIPIYPNMGLLILDKTGGGKTAACRLIKEACLKLDTSVLLPDNCTVEGLKDYIGKTIDSKKVQALKENYNHIRNKNELDCKIEDIRADQKKDLRGKSWVSDEATGTLQKLVGGWDKTSRTSGLRDFLKIMDSGSDLESATRGTGVTIFSDSCLSFFAFTQNKTWQSEFGNSMFKNSGLSGRFLPFTENIKIIGLEKKDKTLFNTILHRVYSAVKDMPKIECVIQGKDKNVDHIGEMKKLFLETTLAKKFKKNYPDDFDNLINKFINFGIKLTQVFSLLNNLELINNNTNKVITIDGTKAFPFCMQLACKLFFAYFEQEEEVSELGELVEKIVNLLRKEPLTLTKIKKSVSSKNRSDVLEAIKMGIEDKDFKSFWEKTQNSRQVLKYRLITKKSEK